MPAANKTRAAAASSVLSRRCVAGQQAAGAGICRCVGKKGQRSYHRYRECCWRCALVAPSQVRSRGGGDAGVRSGWAQCRALGGGLMPARSGCVWRIRRSSVRLPQPAALFFSGISRVGPGAAHGAGSADVARGRRHEALTLRRRPLPLAPAKTPLPIPCCRCPRLWL